MRADLVTRVEAKSLKAQCIECLEGLILSGALVAGEYLPPERELSERLGASRPVVHEAIVDLSSRGFLRVEPRKGVRVADYWREGTLAVFESIILHSDGDFPPDVLRDLVDFRRLVEVEAARLAATRKGGEALERLEATLAEEEAIIASPGTRLGEPGPRAERRAELDTAFHVRLAEASGNRALLLVMHSIRPVYDRLIRRFYAMGPDPGRVLAYHRDLIAALREGSADRAASVTQAMLDEGAAALLGSIAPRTGA